MRALLYLAAPYTQGNSTLNTWRAVKVTNQLMDAGLLVINPLLSHYHHMVLPQPYRRWLDLDLRILQGVDILVRLPGPSAGADREVDEMRRLKRRVIFVPSLTTDGLLADGTLQFILNTVSNLEQGGCGSHHRFRDGAQRCACGQTIRSFIFLDGRLVEYPAPEGRDR